MVELRALAWILAAATMSGAGTAVAQERIRFDPVKLLEGFEDARMSQESDLWQLAEFEALDGELLSADELAAIRQKWAVERERAGKELVHLALDPVAFTRRRLFRRMADHPYFSKLELVECNDFAPVLYLVHKAGKMPADFEKAVAATAGPWLAKAVEAFDQEFAPVLPAARKQGYSILPIVVLASSGDFSNAWRVATIGASNGRGYYDPAMRLAVTHTELLGGPRDDLADRTAALYSLTHAMVDSYAAGTKVPEKFFWLGAGLARFYSRQGGSFAAPLVGQPDERILPWIGGQLRDPDARLRLFTSVEELLQVKSDEDLWNRMVNRAPDRPPTDQEWFQGILPCWQFECGMLVRLLLREEGGRRRGTLLALMAELFGTTEKLKGLGIIDAPPRIGNNSPPRLDMRALQKDLVALLDREIRRVAPDQTLDAAVRTELENLRPLAGANATPAAVGSLVDPAFEPSHLLATPFPIEARIGMALQKALLGRLTEAAGDLFTLRSQFPDNKAWAARCDRDAVRLRTLAELRVEFIERCKTDKKKLRFEQAGSGQSGTVTGIEGDSIVLLDAKNKTVMVPLERLDPDLLLRKMSEQKLELGTVEVRAFAQLLCGRKAWAKGLDGAVAAQAALLEDGKEMPALLRAGDAAGLIQALARAEPPTDVHRAEVRLNDVKTLLTGFATEPLVKERRDGLKQITAPALYLLFPTKGRTATGVRGKLEPLAEGRVRVTWDFEDPREAEDWSPVPFSMQEKKNTVLKTDPAASYLRIEDGALRGLGIQCWRSKLEFQAPIKVLFHLRYIDLHPETDELPFGSMCVGICDDGRKNRIITMEMAGLRVYDGNNFKEDYEKTNYQYDDVYPVTLEHDGKDATLTSPGFPTRSVPVFNRKGGGLTIQCYCDAESRLLDLVIEGALTPQCEAALANDWVAKELVKLFGS